MKIISNYITPIQTSKKYNTSFKQNEVNTNQTVSTQQAPSYGADYNVSVPIAYSKTNNINLPNGLVANCYKLANGQKVVIIPKKGATVVKSYVNTGSLNEPDKIRGISHYIEHNLFNGSEALGDKVFFDEVNKMGADTNASTSFSVTDYYIESQLLEDTDLENKIKLHAGMLQSPKFLQDKLDKEKKVVDSEINMCLSDESSRAVTLMLKNLFNIKSNAPDLIAGSTDNIDALTREDVVNYFNNNYYPANMVTVITGEVDPEDTIKLVSKYFNSTKVPFQNRYYESMTPTDKAIRQDIISQKNQGAAQIILGFAGPENSNANDKVYLRAVNQLLYGLANNRIKDIEQKYSTCIFSSSERLGTRPNDKNAIILDTSVAENYIEPMLKDLYAAVDSLAKYPPTPQEFEAIKEQIKKVNSVSLESSEILNYHIGMDFLNGTPDLTSNYSKIIDNMTYQDFISTARKYYDLNKASLVVIHPSGTNESDIKNNYDKTAKAVKVSFTGKNKKTPLDMNNIKEYQLANNFRVILNNADTDVVNYSINFRKDEYTPRQAALSDVLNDMLQNSGTIYRSKKDFDTYADLNGISQSIVSGSKVISIDADFSTNKINESLNLFKEKIQYPQFTQELFNQAIQHCKDNYTTREPSAVDPYFKAIYKGTPLEYTNKDMLDSLNNITLSDVVAFYSEIINNAQAQVVVTGPFTKNPQLAQAIFNNTAGYYPVKPKNYVLNNLYTAIEKPQVYTVETKRNQAEVYEGFKFPINGNLKDAVCIQLLENILGGSTSSRLFTDLRETRHLAYAVSSDYDAYEDIGTMTLRIKTTTNNTETGEKSFDNIKKSIDGFNENIEKITSQKVSEEELETAKRSLKTDLLSGVEMNADKNSIINSNSHSPYGFSYINQKFDIIDSITSDDILNTARNIFSSKPVYAVSATKEALEANKEYLDNLAK